jgi:hypothetical protein
MKEEWERTMMRNEGRERDRRVKKGTEMKTTLCSNIGTYISHFSPL